MDVNVNDVLEQAKKTKQLAIENAKKTLVEMVSPKLKKSIEKQLNEKLFESDEMSEEEPLEEEDDFDLELGGEENSDEESGEETGSDMGDEESDEFGSEDEGSEEEIDIEEILNMTEDDIDELEPEETADLLKQIITAAEEGEIEVEDEEGDEDEGSEEGDLEVSEDEDEEESEEDKDEDEGSLGESISRIHRKKLMEVKAKIERKRKLREIKERQDKKKSSNRQSNDRDQELLRLENKILKRRLDRTQKQVKALNEEVKDISKFTLQYSYFLKLKNANPYIANLNEAKMMQVVKAFDNVKGKNTQEIENNLKKLYNAFMTETKRVIKNKNLNESKKAAQNKNVPSKKRMLRDTTDTKVLKTENKSVSNDYKNNSVIQEMLSLAIDNDED